MKKNQINDEIRRCYPTEDSIVLAQRLGLTPNNLRRKASRLGIKKNKVTITNEIISGKKLCPKCCKIKDVSQFNKDKYQPNNYDYWCRECREKARKKAIETVHKDSLHDNRSNNKNMAFGVKKTKNPVITVIFNGLEVKGYKCKVCTIDKPYSAFYKLHKSDPDDTLNRKNICIKCIKERRTKNKEL